MSYLRDSVRVSSTREWSHVLTSPSKEDADGQVQADVTNRMEYKNTSSTRQGI